MENVNKVLQELYSLYCLQAVDPTRYSGLRFIGGNESPDLQDTVKGIGVEVTAIDDDQEIRAFYNKYCGKPIDDIPNKVLEIVRKQDFIFTVDENRNVFSILGPHVTDWNTTPDTLSSECFGKIIDSFKKKTKILNNVHSSKFDCNELVIIANIHFDAGKLQTSIEALNKIQKPFASKFRYLHVMPSIWEIVSFDLITGEFQSRSTSEMEQGVLFNVAYDNATSHCSNQTAAE